jgi:Tfp pilus assembly protein PilF
MTDAPQSDLGRRLDSWKEIATFFGREERTVRRWEKEQALPVHRIPGGAKGRVFAYEAELRDWLSASHAAPSTSVPIPETPAPQSPPIEEHRPISEAANGSSASRATRKWIAALVGCAILMAAVFSYASARRLAGRVWAATPMGRARSGNSAAAEAEDLYLKGRFYWNKRTPEDLTRAVDYFTQAIVRDPNYAKAYVGLADSYNLLREFGSMPENEAYPRALAAAQKAVELDDSSAEAHTSLAFVTYFWNWDPDGAEREFRRALELDPNDARAHHWYASFLLSCRRLPEALEQIEIARRLDPSSSAILADKGVILSASHRSDEALALLEQLQVSDPSFSATHRYLSWIYFDRTDYSNYLAEWGKMAALTHDEQDLALQRAAKQGFVAGGYQGMLEAILNIQRQRYRQGAMPAYAVAVTCAELGRKQEVWQYLEQSYEKRENSLLFLSTETAFLNLHDEPEFRDLAGRVGPSARAAWLAESGAIH